MVRLPYGGIADSASSPNAQDGPWERLDAIAGHLEKGESIPPFLARWLGEAIKRSNHDEKRLNRNLGLRKPAGGQKIVKDDILGWGALICRLEDEGTPPEQAIAEVQKQIGSREGKDEVSRTTLQTWRDKYREFDQQYLDLRHGE